MNTKRTQFTFGTNLFFCFLVLGLSSQSLGKSPGGTPPHSDSHAVKQAKKSDPVSSDAKVASTSETSKDQPLLNEKLSSSPENRFETVPLDKESSWIQIPYDKIPPNQVEFHGGEVHFHILKSNSVVAYKLPTAVKIKKLKYTVEIQGELATPPAAAKPSKIEDWEDDYMFRVGLVATGKNTLGVFGRKFAPQWVQKLYALVPEGMGLDKVYFYNIGRAPMEVGMNRIHPESRGQFYEEIVALRDSKSNLVSVQKDFNPEREIAAFWISTDGDNTQSTYHVTLKSLSYQTAP